MPEHPCAGGLSPACFKAYPKWAKQALAYKLLHILLPKQLSKKLPMGLGKAFIGEGAVLPPGLVLPPGVIIPPGFVWPASWGTYEEFISNWEGVPWILIPWPWLQPSPPLFVQAWEPGPVHRVYSGGWVSIFDPIYWKTAPSHCGLEPMMEWTADNQWHALNCGSGEDLMSVMLIPIEDPGWQTNFRPRYARITFIDTIPATKLGFLDTGGFLIASNMAPVSPQIFTFDWSHGNDIMGISIYSLGTYLTNIEFFGGALGTV